MPVVREGAIVIEPSTYLSYIILNDFSNRIIMLHKLFKIISGGEITAYTALENSHTIVIKNIRNPKITRRIDVAIPISSIILQSGLKSNIQNSIEDMGIDYYVVAKPFWCKICRLENINELFNEFIKLSNSIINNDVKNYENISIEGYYGKISIFIKELDTCDKLRIVYMKPYHYLTYGIGMHIEYFSGFYKESLKKYLASLGDCDPLAYIVSRVKNRDFEAHEFLCVNDYRKYVNLLIPKFSNRGDLYEELKEQIIKILFKSFLYINCG